MKIKRTVFVVLAVLVLSISLVGGLVFAHDDGPLFTRNLSRTPDTMTGAAQLSHMPLYVPAQNTQGEPPETETGELEYYAGDCTNSTTSECTLIYTRPEAKPLIATYNDGIEEELVVPEGMSGIETGAGFGKRDAFAALSLDDGATWKDWNLSDSADRSSFVLRNGEPYPGDVFKLVHQVEGNRVVAAWISRYCESGAPLYSWLEDEKDGLLTVYPELAHPVNVDGGTDEDGYYELYVDDMFTVGGSQSSVDYTAQGFPEVGEIPYGCVWVARGTLEQDLDDSGNPLTNVDGDPIYDITWRASERLTSGRRDPHQISISSSPGAGFYVMWQEDPEGLRPGKGLGPGEGWSGAIANSRTDTWYTYIDIAHVDDVCLDDVDGVYCTPGTLVDFTTSELFGQKPKAAVPFAMPVRVTDNNMCKATQKIDSTGQLIDPYCYADFDANGTADLCAAEVDWTNSADVTIKICKAEDGRVINGRTASTRARGTMKPYDSDGDGAPDSAWVLFGEEKMKALGTVLDEYLEPEDIGKDMWYHTFEFDKPELAQQGLMLNSPALSPETGEFFEILIDEWDNEFYDTEIARRFNLFVNSAPAALASTSKTMGLLIYKEGIIRQGGPADIFIRRLVLPDDFDPAVDNPFAYENVQCLEYADDGTATPVDLLYPDGVNPNYVRGLCPVAGMNVSGTTIQLCDDGTSGDACAEQFPYDLSYEDWGALDDSEVPKVTEWVQAPDNYNDPSWGNPYDVSKGHRGFIDGDFVMMMYATAPNWKAGTVGNEAYNLYIRRSFDGGQTWTTLPASFTHINGITYSGDGTATCEDWGWGGTVEYEQCTTYAAGDFEQARNVSRLTGSKITVLDPRYSPSGGMLKESYKNLLCDPELDNIWTNCGYTDDASAPYPEEIRDPSVFFGTFETGDNTVVTVETGASPLDMYYSRAFNFGDDWDEQDICAVPEDQLPWYPNTSATCDEDETELRWDWLENGDDWATEASVEGNPSGDRFYSVWNQELFLGLDPDGVELFTDMDAMFRRIFYNLDADAVPAVWLVSIPTPIVDLDTEISLLGAAVDNDHVGEGIVEFEWTMDGEVVSSDRYFKAPPRTLSKGWHGFGFRAKDHEGNWSKSASFEILVVDTVYTVRMPSILLNK